MTKDQFLKNVMAQVKDEPDNIKFRIKAAVSTALLKVSFPKMPQRARIIVKEPEIEQIIADVCTAAGISESALKERTRFREFCMPRQMIVYIVRETYGKKHSSIVIAAHLGGYDHTTILHGRKVIENHLETNQPDVVELYRKYLAIRNPY